MKKKNKMNYHKLMRLIFNIAQILQNLVKMMKKVCYVQMFMNQFALSMGRNTKNSLIAVMLVEEKFPNFCQGLAKTGWILKKKMTTMKEDQFNLKTKMSLKDVVLV